MTIRIQTLDLKTSRSALPAGQKKKFGWTICEDSNLIQNRSTILLRQSKKTNFRINSREDSNLRLCSTGIKDSISRAGKKICVDLYKKLQLRLTCQIKNLVDFFEDSNLRSTDFAVNDYKDSNLRP